MKTCAPKRDLHREITDQIVEQLERGVAPWVKPWRDGPPLALPRNASGRAYNGINIVILWAAAIRGAFRDPRWFTYRQAKAAGGHVRKGQKGQRVVLWRQVEKKELDESGDPKTYAFMTSYTVFNAAQIEGLEPPSMDPTRCDVDRFIAETGADIWEGPDRACYHVGEDYITVPRAEDFVDRGAFHAVVLHELCHFSGARHRLDRDQSGSFGTKAYAREELVAELGSAFLCAEFGIEGTLQHPEYLASWLEVLREDSRAIFKAAREASRAARYLHGLAGSNKP